MPEPTCPPGGPVPAPRPRWRMWLRRGLLAALALSLTSALAAAAWWWSIDPAAIAARMREQRTPGPRDGEGYAALDPAMLRANASGQQLTLTLRAGASGVDTGGGYRFYLPVQVVGYAEGPAIEPPIIDNWFYWLNPLLYSPGFYALAGPPGVELELVHAGLWRRLELLAALAKSVRAGAPAFNMKELNLALARVGVRVTRGRLAPGADIGVTIGAGAQLATPHFPTQVDVAVESDPDGDGAFRLLAASPTVRTRSPARRLEVFAPSTPRPGEPFTVFVQGGCCELYPERDPLYEAELTLSAEGLELPGRAVIGRGDAGIARVEARAPREGVYVVRARDDARGFEAESAPIVCRREGPRLLWGDIHRHSILGDGVWKAKDVLAHARDIEHLDFACLSEHDLSIVTYYMTPDRDLTRVPGVRQEAHKWRHLEAVTRAARRPGRFAALLGYEWTSHEDGHRNVYFRPGSEPVYLDHLDGPGRTAEGLLAALRDREVLIVLHHPAWRGGDEMGARVEWGEPGHPRQRLVEVYSQHGSSERPGGAFPIHGRWRLFMALPRGVDDDGGADPDPPWYLPIGGYTPGDASPPGLGNYVQEALADGQRLGLIASSDNHFLCHMRMSHPGGLVALWAPELTEEAVYDALCARRAYGTTGARMALELRVDGAPIGSEVAWAGPPAVSWWAAGTAPLAKVELVRFSAGRYTLADVAEPLAREARSELIDRHAAPPCFYYLRVTQEDGHMGWAGPVWVEEREGR